MRRLLFIVSGVVLVETVFFSALAPLLPRYAHDLGLSKFGAGVLVGSYAAGGFVGALPGGFLASRLGVKLTMLTGLGLLAALSGVFGFAGSVWLLDLARFGQGVGAALAWTGALAWLVTEAPRERRGELIGVAVGAAAVGALLGPAVGVTATIIGTRTTFLAVALLGAALAAWALRVPGPGPGEGQSLWLLLPATRRPGVATGLWLLALPSLMFGVLGVLAPLQLGRLGLSGSAIGAIFLIAALLEAGASVVFGRWAGLVLELGHDGEGDASTSRQAFSRVCQSGCSLTMPPVLTGLVAPISSCSCSSAVVIASSDSSLSRICVASSGVSASSRQRSSSRSHCGWRFQTEIVSGATPISSAICLREWPCVCSNAARRARSEKLRRACGPRLSWPAAPACWLAFDIDRSSAAGTQGNRAKRYRRSVTEYEHSSRSFPREPARRAEEHEPPEERIDRK